MKCIAFDLSTDHASLAVGTPEEWISETIVGSRLQAKALLPLLEKLLADYGWRLAMIDAIAFGHGPGSFTGLRVAASVAQGLGLGSGIPLISMSSLAVLAQTAYRVHGVPHVCATLDARMQEIYAGTFHCHDGLMQLVGEESVLSPEKCVLPHDAVYIGPGVHAYAAMMNLDPTTLLPCLFPDAGDLIVRVPDAIHTGAVVRPAEVSLHYVRNTVVHKK